MEQMNTGDPLLEAEANMRKNAGDPRMRGRGKQWARSRLMHLRRLEDVSGSKRPADRREERPAKRRRAGAAKRVRFANPLAVSAAPTVVQPPPPASPPTLQELTKMVAYISDQLDAIERPLREAVKEAPPPASFQELAGSLARMGGRLDAMEQALQEAQNPEPIDVDTVDGIPIVQSSQSITDEDAADAVAAEREHEGMVSNGNEEMPELKMPVDVQREIAVVLVAFDDYACNPYIPNMRVEVVDAQGTARGMTPRDMFDASPEMKADTVLTVLQAIRDHEIPLDVEDAEAYVRQQLTMWSLEAFMDDYASRFRVALQQYTEGEHADDDDSDFDGDGIDPSDVSAATAVWDAFTAGLGR